MTLFPERVDMSDFDERMEELTEGGCHDSEGTFSIDPTAAREKMSRFQLPERAYVLNLVAALVAGGARRLTVLQDPNELKLAGDARGIKEDALQNLFGSPFARTSEQLAVPQIRELAIGLHGALTLQPRWIKVECDDGKQAFSLHLNSEEHKVATMETTGSCFFRIHVKFPSSLMQTLFTPQKDLIESRLVADRCSLAPVREFSLNKRPGRYALSLGRTLAHKIGNNAAQTHIGLVRAESGVRVEAEGDRSFVISLNEDSDAPNLNFIHHGVSFQETFDFDWLPLRATVWAGGELQKDLSQAALVKDAAWFEWIEFLREQATGLVEILCGRLDQLSAEDRARTLELCLGLVAYRRSCGRLSEGLSLLEELGPRAESPPFLYQRACLELESGRHMPALGLFASLAEEYTKTGHDDEAADCLRKVLDCRRGHDDSPDQMMNHWDDLLRCLYKQKDVLSAGLVVEDMLEWLDGKEPGPSVHRRLESFLNLAEVKQDDRSVELLQKAVSDLTSQPACPACGTRKVPEKGRLVSDGKTVDFEMNNGDIRAVSAMACCECGFLWFSRSE